ncbi:MAG: hypothetical protein HND47_24565 [Chloroflexi bacterium]|nr:hypothetical protein [Chloroflexota bacterium]
MSNKILFRLAGWLAIVFIALSILGGVCLAVIFYALYVFHRLRAATLGLVMLACGIVSLIFENAAFMMKSGAETMLSVRFVLLGIAFLLLGYLGYGNDQTPRWLAVSAYLVGVAGLAAGGAGLLGQASIALNASYLMFIPFLVWLVGMSRWFLKTAAA